MEIIFKLTIPDKLIKEIDAIAEELWPRDFCWWDVVWSTMQHLEIIGKPEFVEIVYKKKWWKRLLELLTLKGGEL